MKRDRKVVPTALGVVGLSLLGACGTSDQRSGGPSPAAAAPTAATPVSVHVTTRDPRSGAPSFAWLSRKPSAATTGLVGRAKTARAKPSALEAAWGALRGLSPAYALTRAAVDGARLVDLHDAGHGPILARFTQHVGEVEVFGAHMTVALTRDMDPLVASGTFAADVSPSAGRGFTRDGREAVASAYEAFAKAPLAAAAITVESDAAPYTRYAAEVAAGPRLVEPARVKPVYFRTKRGLEPAHYVELHLVGLGEEGGAELRSFVFSAVDGKKLFENRLTHDAFTYRVYAEATDGPYKLRPYDGPQGSFGTPHPTGKPDGYQAPFVPTSLVTVDYLPGSRAGKPWLPEGAQVTTGNNVDAFANLALPDGFGEKDVRPTVTSPGVFDYAFDPKVTAGSNATQINAAAVQLFYTLNYLHDWFYDAGWDEASGNPQKDNFGRGGKGNDPITAQALDASGRNNANASTPADGASPRIRMYIFDGDAVNSRLDVRVGGTESTLRDVGRASFGPRKFDVKGPLVAALDEEGSKTDGCQPFTNAADVKGKIALIDRGTCAFTIKVQNAQDAGAIGVVLVNNQPGGPMRVPGAPTKEVTIPTISVAQAQGPVLREALGKGSVDVTLYGELPLDRDGSMDTAIVAHEWGHVLSNRLIGDGNGLDNGQGGGMGEGWSDFVALLTMVRAEDKDAPGSTNWTGAYAVGGYVNGSDGQPGNNGYLYGVRRYPYSADLARNPLTFRHVQNGNALPANPAPSSGASGANNAEVHNTGEVWASLLWDCFVALLRDTGRYTFESAHERMRKYLVASLKLTPSSPTILEARDAVLATALATDAQDFQLFAEAFARRGAGVGAVGPGKDSEDNGGVEESTALGADVDIVEAKVEAPASRCNPEAVLRNDEPGTLSVTLRNGGTAALKGARVLVTADAKAAEIGGAGAIDVPDLGPFAVTKVTLPVTLKGAEPLAKVALNVAVDAKPETLARAKKVSLVVPGVYNYDVAEYASTTDRFETPKGVWTAQNGSGAPGKATRVPNDDRQKWVIPDAPSTSDEALVSPYLAAPSKGELTLVVTHRYSFEASEIDAQDGGKRTAFFDGGVIELSGDDGKTWQDVGGALYNATLESEQSDNPLKGRKALGGASEGFAEGKLVQSRIALGSAFAGRPVRVRFRVGTDGGVGAPGWEITEVSLENAANKPFPTRVPVAAGCGDKPGGTTEPTPVEAPAPTTPEAPAPQGAEAPAPSTPTPVKDSEGGCAAAPRTRTGGLPLIASAGALLGALLVRRRRRVH